MSAAVSAMQHQSGAGANPTSRIGTSSPADNKRVIKSEESAFGSKLSNKTDNVSTSHATEQSSDQSARSDSIPKSRDNPRANAAATEEAANDYFSMPRPSRLDQEPNPFEQSFAGGSTSGTGDPLNTPKAILPPVTAMTSPAPLLGSSAYNWGPNSLRSGPLSPAMLTGPTNPTGSLGFDHIRSGLTPNESGIRSGLTPGGSGSMFPAPSPSTSFMFGGATPGTMEFQKTALSAARKSHPPPPLIQSQNQELKVEDANVGHVAAAQDSQQKPRQSSDLFNADPAHNAANGLYLLANAPTVASYQPVTVANTMPTTTATASIDTSPNLAKHAAVNNANHSRTVSGASGTNSNRGASEMSNDRSESSQEPEPASSARKRRAQAKGKAVTASTGKRKNDDTGATSKAAANKKTKGARSMSASDDGEDYEEEMEQPQSEGKKDNKKMTDEEKRKNFLERNRVAALKCRQRKKQWLQNLQAKVELYGSENDALNATVQQLREEIVSLKTLLLAHKDCPIARANGVQLDIAAMAAGGDYGGHVGMMPAPYSGMMPTNVIHPQQQAADQRRFS